MMPLISLFLGVFTFVSLNMLSKILFAFSKTSSHEYVIFSKYLEHGN